MIELMLINTGKIILPELSYTVVGICMKVHRELGPELLEKYYQRAVEKELLYQKVKYVRELPVKLSYQGQSIGRYFIDFLIEDTMVLELKAKPYFSRAYFKQVLAYLRQLNLPLGLVVNFRTASIKPERVINSRYNQNIRLNSE